LYLVSFQVSSNNAAENENRRKPNLVIFYVDDLGYGDLGSYGHSIVKTPNIDQLAKEGIQYTQYYAPAPLCSPSRAGMLTGRTPYRTGIRSWIPEGQNVHLGKNEITIAHQLKKMAYDTAVMGKLHLNGGLNMEDHPQADDMGFDYSYIITGGFITTKSVKNSKPINSLRYGKMYPDNFVRNNITLGQSQKFSGELVADETINWLAQQKGEKPFFLYIPFSEVHTPVASPQKYIDMYTNHLSDFAIQTPDLYYFDWLNTPHRGAGEYYANISFLDHQVGRVLAKLKEMGLEDNTIIIFTSDNGPVTRETRKPWELNMAGETAGYRGRKDNLFEGGIRVPAIIKYKGKVAVNQVSNEVVTGLDIFPTLAELMLFELPTDRPIDGASITPTFSQKSVQRAAPFIWTIDMPNQDDAVNEWAIRDGDWKLILDRDERPKYLFNLKKDPYEMTNLIGKEPKIVATLMPKFQQIKKSIELDSVND
jgi:arylsulfatase A-like enzyme